MCLRAFWREKAERLVAPMRFGNWRCLVLLLYAKFMGIEVLCYDGFCDYLKLS